MAENSREHFEMMFGQICSPVEKLGEKSGGLVEVVVNESSLEKLIAYWSQLPVNSLPRLRGISMGREGKPALQMILDGGSKVPFVLLTATWDSKKPLPELRGVWPYAAWWEEELRSFENTQIGLAPAEAEIVWRRN